MKRYATDWAKEKSRDLVRDMISSTVMTFRKPGDLRVLCFPGIDAAEVFQVYDPLGIPRSNIVGIERDSNVAKEIESKNLGIQLVQGSFEEYIYQQRSIDFDIVSLDYIGPVGPSQADSLKDLVGKQRKNHFVLHTANLIRRDSQSTGLYYFGYSFGDEHSETIDARGIPIATLERRTQNSFRFQSKMFGGESFGDEKKTAYSQIIKASYTGFSRDQLALLLRFAAGSEYESVLVQCEADFSRLSGRIISIDRENPFDSLRGFDQPLGQSLLEHAIDVSLRIECQKFGILDKDIQFMLLQALYNVSRGSKHFLESDSTCYSYISETGAPMMGDINFLRHPMKIVEISKEMARLVGFSNRFQFNPSNYRKLAKLALNYSRENVKLFPTEKIDAVMHNRSNRQFVGNSSKPVLTKKRAIDEFRSGVSVDDVKEKYRAWEEKPLAQWKAHVTMGTYDQKRQVEPESLEEQMSREDALNLIDAGIPLEEIVDAFPESITIGRLRAFKAHRTMGTYDKNAATGP